MTTDTLRAPAIRRCLLLSGSLQMSIGLGHNVLGTLILIRPAFVTPLVESLGWPMSILTPLGSLVPPEQYDLVLAMSLASGTAWMLFGAILVWQGFSRPARPDVPLLAIVLAYQLVFLLLMVRFVSFHVPVIVIGVAMATALGTALAKALRADERPERQSQPTREPMPAGERTSR